MTTGVAFHYDRPNAEPPQAWLLALPASFDGAWSWDELVGAVTETLDAAKLPRDRAGAPRRHAVRRSSCRRRTRPGRSRRSRSPTTCCATSDSTTQLEERLTRWPRSTSSREPEDALAARHHPAITRWNRLEGRPRTHDFDRALHAEVRDALWMLSRQWQLGEFVGDDAGSPVLARACLDLRTLDRYQPGHGAVQPLDADGVARADGRAAPAARSRSARSTCRSTCALPSGGAGCKLLRAATSRRRPTPRSTATPTPSRCPTPRSEADAQVCAHADAWQQAALRRRTGDGRHRADRPRRRRRLGRRRRRRSSRATWPARGPVRPAAATGSTA